MKPNKDKLVAMHVVAHNSAGVRAEVVGRPGYAAHPLTRLTMIGIQVGNAVEVFDVAAGAAGNIDAAAVRLQDLDALGHTFAVHDVPLQGLLLREKLELNLSQWFDTASYRKYRQEDAADLAPLTELDRAVASAQVQTGSMTRVQLARPCASAVANVYAAAAEAVDDDLFPDWEWAVVEQLCQMQLSGVSIDLNFAKELHRRAVTASAETTIGLVRMGFRPDEAADNAAIVGFVADKFGVRLASSSMSHPDVIAARRDDPELNRFFTLVKQAAALGNLTLQLQRLQKCGGRLSNHIHYYGSHTGRFTSGGADVMNFNLHGLPKSRFVAQVRKVVVPPVGMAFVASDLKAIEARVLAFLAGESDLVERFRANEDVYTSFGHEVDPSAPRALGKEAILGLGFGMGLKKFAKQVRAKIGDIDEALVDNAYATYHQTFPRVSGLPQAMASAVKKAAASGRATEVNGVTFEFAHGEQPVLAVKLPTGRHLFYRQNLKDDGLAVWFEPNAGRGAPSLRILPHTLVENIVQAIARDVLVGQMLEVGQQGVDVAFTVHDEIVAVAPRCDCGRPDRRHTDTCSWAAVRDKLTACMSKVPACFPALADLPLGCEVDEDIHDSYGAEGPGDAGDV